MGAHLHSHESIVGQASGTRYEYLKSHELLPVATGNSGVSAVATLLLIQVLLVSTCSAVFLVNYLDLPKGYSFSTIYTYPTFVTILRYLGLPNLYNDKLVIVMLASC